MTAPQRAATAIEDAAQKVKDAGKQEKDDWTKWLRKMASDYGAAFLILFGCLAGAALLLGYSGRGGGNPFARAGRAIAYPFAGAKKTYRSAKRNIAKA